MQQYNNSNSTIIAVTTITILILGHLFIFFLPAGLRIVYFLLVYPLLWVIGGYLGYKYYLHRKEQDKFLGK